MNTNQLQAWFWGSGMASVAIGFALSLYPLSAKTVGITALIIGVLLCTKAALTKPENES